MSSVSDRRKAFENPASLSSPSSLSSSSSKGHKSNRNKKIGTFSSRRNKEKGNRPPKEPRVDLSDDEEMLEESEPTSSRSVPPKSPARFGKYNKPKSLSDSTNGSTTDTTTSDAASEGVVDLDLTSSELSSKKGKPRPTLSSAKKQESDISVDVDLFNDKNDNGDDDGPSRNPSGSRRSSAWARVSGLFTDPVEEEKLRQEELLMKMMRESDASFNEQTYKLEKETQSIFVETKKEEIEQKKIEEARREAARLARTKVSWWESIVQALISMFISSVESEKRRQEKALLDRLPLLDLRMDEEDVRREMETQALLVNMKKKEMERDQSRTDPLRAERRRKSALLVEKLSDPSIGLDQSLIVSGRKMQQDLVRRSMSKSKSLELAQQEIPLDVQKQMQEELLLEMADDHPEIGISEHALKRSREVQESLIFYAQKNKKTGWFESILGGTSSSAAAATGSNSIPEEVEADDASTRVSWLSGLRSNFSESSFRSTNSNASGGDDAASVSSWLFGGSTSANPNPSPSSPSSTMSPGGFKKRKNTKKANRSSWLTLSMMTNNDANMDGKNSTGSSPWSPENNLHSLGEEEEVHRI
eukprot:scaffold22585_cov149-Cylindrotheca_fusiformis.AAC.9